MTDNSIWAYVNAIEIFRKSIKLCNYRDTDEFREMCEKYGGDLNYVVRQFKWKHAKLYFGWMIIQAKIRRALGKEYPFLPQFTEEAYLSAQLDSIEAYNELLEKVGENPYSEMNLD